MGWYDRNTDENPYPEDSPESEAFEYWQDKMDED